MDLKTCARCKGESPLDGFNVDRRSKGGRSSYCRSCSTAQSRQTHQKRRDAAREYHRRKTYGIGSEEYDELLRAQGGRCAICGTDDPGGRRIVKSFFIDHCHETGQVRGLLCCSCNLILGHAKDSTERLLQAALYLEVHNR